MIRQYIQAGDLGEVYRVENRHWRARGRPAVDNPNAGRWFADSRLAMGGILADIGLYHMDQAFYLAGWPAVTAVSAVVMRPFAEDGVPPDLVYDVEEHALVLARTAGKLTFTFELANIAFYDDWYTETLMLLGNKGGMHVVNGRREEFRFLTEKGGPGKFVEHRIDWKEKRRTDTLIYEELALAARGRRRSNPRHEQPRGPGHPRGHGDGLPLLTREARGAPRGTGPHGTDLHQGLISGTSRPSRPRRRGACRRRRPRGTPASPSPRGTGRWPGCPGRPG